MNTYQLNLDIQEVLGEEDTAQQIRKMATSPELRGKLLGVLKKHIDIPPDITSEFYQVVYCIDKIDSGGKSKQNVVLRMIDAFNISLRDAEKPPGKVWAPKAALLPEMTGEGRGGTVASFSLPEDHWLYQSIEESPAPFKMGISDERDRMRVLITEAARYAIQGATLSGKATDFDPDALVQNFIIGMLGYNTPNGEYTYSISVKKTLSEKIRYAIQQDAMLEIRDGEYFFPLDRLEELLDEDSPKEKDEST